MHLNTLARAETSNSWDLTLLRIIPYIDGVASVSRISQLADADLNLTRKAIAHLVYYGCVILLDIFQFGAIYAPTADFGAFVESTEMQAECLRYVMIPFTQQQNQIGSGDGKGGIFEGMGKKTDDGMLQRGENSSIDYGDNNDADVTLGSSYRSTATITPLRQSTSRLTSGNLNNSMSSPIPASAR